MTEASLDEIAARTLGHYESRARAFWEGTKDHDVSQNIDALLGAIERMPARILDLGCGPGRDLVTLKARGHEPVGLDGCEAFVRMAQQLSGCEVLHQSFFDLALEPLRFDGVFANASLFHVPRALLPDVLGRLHAALRPDGVLFCSNPRAFDADDEGFHGERYGSYLTVESWTRVIGSAGFTLEHAYLRPAGRPPEQQPWSAMVWRKG